MPCALDKVWNCQRQCAVLEKETKSTQAVAETNSNEFGRQGILRFQKSRYAPPSSRQSFRQYQSLCLETAWHLSRLRRIPRQVSYTINRSPSALVPCAERCCYRDWELVFHFLPTILIFCCLDPFMITSFNDAYLIFSSFRSEEVIDSIFPSFLWSSRVF